MPSVTHQLKTINSPSSHQHPAPLVKKTPRVLVLTPQVEVRHTLVHTLERLSADVITCSTKAQAEEVLSDQDIDLLFCDEHLSDGSYRDLIHPNNFARKVPRIVLTTRTGEWDLYFKALGNGAYDIVRAPWHATDIEMILIRAQHEQQQQSSAATAA